MDHLNFLLTFENCSPHEARSAAQDLEMALFQALPGIKIDWKPHHPHAQDIGSVLDVMLPLLGTPVAVVFATALSDWLKRRKDVILTVRNADREIILQNITYKEAEQQLPRLTQLVSLEAPEKREGRKKSAESSK